MAQGDCKDLARRTVSDKDLRDRVFSIQKIQNMTHINGWQSFDKKSKGSGASMLADTPNQQSVDQLHKSIIGKYQKRVICIFTFYG